jgi:cold shock protein
MVFLLSRGGAAMPTGKVKWFDNAKGFGFIRCDGYEKDIFVHYSNIVADGFRTLAEGDSVSFDLVEGPKGLKAENVTPETAPA